MGIEEDWDQDVRWFLKKHASDEEADASLFLQSLTTFALKPNEHVQEYPDRWNHQVYIFKYINDFAEEEDKAPVSSNQLADAFVYGLGYDSIVTTKLKTLKVILIEGTLEGFVKQVPAKFQEIELNTRKQSEQLAAREMVKQHPVLAYKSEIYRDQDEKGGGLSNSDRDRLDCEWERIGREKERLEKMECEKRAQSQYRPTSVGGNYGSATVVTEQPTQRTAQAAGTQAIGGGPKQAGTTSMRDVNGGGRQCYRCGSVEHLANVCSDKPKKLLCLKCHEEGHYANQCPHGEEKGSIEYKGFLLSTHNTPGYGSYEECEDTFLILALQEGYYLDPDARVGFSAYDPPVRGERVETKHKHDPDKIGGRSWEDQEEEAEIGSARWWAMMADKRRKEADPSARPDAPALRKQRVEGETSYWTPQIPNPASMRRDRRRPTATSIVQIPVKRRSQHTRPIIKPARKPIRRPADAFGPARGGDQVVQLPEIPDEHRRVGSIAVPARRPEDGNAGNLGSQVGVGVGVDKESQNQVASPNDGNGSSGRKDITPPV
ncbi:hypothetical protein HDV00_010781 [Rhizophlyctis rosea]|nr:hypothetical protein HDV00_010781 [Rhizophlyctis rosea]